MFCDQQQNHALHPPAGSFSSYGTAMGVGSWDVLGARPVPGARLVLATSHRRNRLVLMVVMLDPGDCEGTGLEYTGVRDTSTGTATVDTVWYGCNPRSTNPAPCARAGGCHRTNRSSMHWTNGSPMGNTRKLWLIMTSSRTRATGSSPRSTGE